MRRLFGKGGRKLQLESLDLPGWTDQGRVTPTSIKWVNKDGEVVGIHLMQRPTWLQPFDAPSARIASRQLVESMDAGVVSLDSFPDATFPCAQLIYKRERGSGYRYVVMLFIAVEESAFVVSGAWSERGTTGVREALVTAQLVEEGRLEFEELPEPHNGDMTGTIKGWFVDPFDPAYRGKVLRSISDDERYDPIVPDHPLTRIRINMTSIRASMRLRS
jgi:hypothetical protein